MSFFGVGPGEAVLVLVLALLLVGPDRFPEFARQAGRYYKLARRYTDEVMADVRAAVGELEHEIAAPGDGLRSIREIGSGLSSELRAVSSELNASNNVAPPAPEGGETTGAADPPPATSVPTPLRTPEQQPAGAHAVPVDPFAALKARREREQGTAGDRAGEPRS